VALETHLAAPLSALIAALALCGWSVWSYRRSLSPLGAGQRRLLLALRLAASLLLALMLGGLDLVLDRQRREAPLLRVLVDASASMQRPVGASGGSPSRYARARELLSALGERYGERLRLAPVAFGAGLLAGELPASAVAPVTDIGAALAGLPPAEPGEALLVISDGCDTEGGLWAGALRGGRPLHGIVLGDSVPPADLRLDRVEALPVLRKGARLPLAVEIVATGDAPRAGRLSVREGERLLADTEWLLEPGDTRARIELPLALEGVGEHLLTLAIERAGSPDAAPANDRRLLAVRVVESRLRVLVLAGRPDWDLGALLDGLRGEESLELVAVTPGPTGALREAATGRPWSPATEEWHGLVLHSWQAGWAPDLLERLRLRGGALVLGGFLEQAGSARLPERWQLALPRAGRAAGAELEPRLRWGADAAHHAALQGALALGTDPAALPAIECASANPLAGGRELLVAAAGPLLVARELGGQRIAVCSGRGLWRWPLHGETGAPLYEELFSGLLRWLAREDPPARLVVDWGEEPLAAGQPGRLRAEVFDPDFRPLADAELDWSLARPAGDSLLAAGPFARAGAAFAAQLPALPEGVYRLALRARLASGETLARSLELPVQTPPRELLELAARPETLRWLAGQTGGRLIAAEDLGALEAALDFTPRSSTSRRILRLWQHPLAFLLLLALLGSEWGLRKRFGMV